jgi:Flp pilus assembly protein TadD
MYLSGNLKKARSYLQRAVKLLEPDLIIRHHLKVVEKKLAGESS